MLKKYISSWFHSNKEQTSSVIATPAEPVTEKFSSQNQMLHDLGRDHERGFCNPLTNLYVKERAAHIDSEHSLFHKRNIDVYRAARLEEDHQFDLRDNGLDGKHSAFVDLNQPFTVERMPANLAVSLTIESVLKSNKAIITYPVKGDMDIYHQVYIESEGATAEGEDRSCVSFDSARTPTEKKGPCSTLLSEFFSKISTSEDPHRSPKEVDIARPNP